jgi:hypothetical protein
MRARQNAEHGPAAQTTHIRIGRRQGTLIEADQVAIFDLTNAIPISYIGDAEHGAKWTRANTIPHFSEIQWKARNQDDLADHWGRWRPPVQSRCIPRPRAASDFGFVLCQGEKDEISFGAPPS